MEIWMRKCIVKFSFGTLKFDLSVLSLQHERKSPLIIHFIERFHPKRQNNIKGHEEVTLTSSAVDKWFISGLGLKVFCITACVSWAKIETDRVFFPVTVHSVYVLFQPIWLHVWVKWAGWRCRADLSGARAWVCHPEAWLAFTSGSDRKASCRERV